MWFFLVSLSSLLCTLVHGVAGQVISSLKAQYHFHFAKGISMAKSESLLETVKGAPRQRPGQWGPLPPWPLNYSDSTQSYAQFWWLGFNLSHTGNRTWTRPWHMAWKYMEVVASVAVCLGRGDPSKFSYWPLARASDAATGATLTMLVGKLGLLVLTPRRLKCALHCITRSIELYLKTHSEIADQNGTFKIFWWWRP